MFWLKVVLLTCAVLAYCESATIDGYLKKCGMTDGECEKQMYQSLLQGLADSGVPEMGIPVFNPFEFKNLGTTVLGLANVTLVKGVLKNIKSCQINKYQKYVEISITSLELICDSLIIDGQYKIQSTSLLESLVEGVMIHGKGRGIFRADKLKLNLDMAYDIKKLNDGELHIIMNPDETTYTFDIGKVTVAADNLYVGNQDISAIAVDLLNKNWKTLLNIAGRSVFDVGVEIFVEYANKFFTAVPAKIFISDDLSSYVNN